MFRKLFGPSKAELINKINEIQIEMRSEYAKSFASNDERLGILEDKKQKHKLNLIDEINDKYIKDIKVQNFAINNRLNHIDIRLSELSNKFNEIDAFKTNIEEHKESIHDLSNDMQQLVRTFNIYDNRLIELDRVIKNIDIKYRTTENTIHMMQERVNTNYIDTGNLKDVIKKITTKQQADIDKLEGDIETINTKHRYQVSGLKGHITRNKNK